MFFNLHFDFLFHANLIEGEFVHEFGKLFDKVFFFDVGTLAVRVAQSRTAIVDVAMDISILLFLEFLVCCNT